MQEPYHLKLSYVAAFRLQCVRPPPRLTKPINRVEATEEAQVLCCDDLPYVGDKFMDLLGYAIQQFSTSSA